MAAAFGDGVGLGEAFGVGVAFGVGDAFGVGETFGVGVVFGTGDAAAFFDGVGEGVGVGAAITPVSATQMARVKTNERSFMKDPVHKERRFPNRRGRLKSAPPGLPAP